MPVIVSFEGSDGRIEAELHAKYFATFTEELTKSPRVTAYLLTTDRNLALGAYR